MAHKSKNVRRCLYCLEVLSSWKAHVESSTYTYWSHAVTSLHRYPGRGKYVRCSPRDVCFDAWFGYELFHCDNISPIGASNLERHTYRSGF